jgi:hypothetical protein
MYGRYAEEVRELSGGIAAKHFLDFLGAECEKIHRRLERELARTNGGRLSPCEVTSVRAYMSASWRAILGRRTSPR